MPASTAYRQRGSYRRTYLPNEEPMEAIPLKEIRRVKREASKFAKAVRRAKDINQMVPDPVPVLSSLDEFYDNALLLYLSLWYADTEGVTVTFKPTERPQQTASKPSRPPKKK